MGRIHGLLSGLIAGWTARGVRSKPPRSASRRILVGEALEGRALLSTGWVGGRALAAEVRPLAGIDAQRAVGRAAAKLGRPIGRVRDALTDDQARAALQTLQDDLRALRARIPADLAARVEADRTLIAEARATLSQMRGKRSNGDWSAPTPDMVGSGQLARVATMLRNSGVTDRDVNAVLADFTAYKKVFEGLDPALNARIAASRASLTRAFGQSRLAGLLGIGTI